jgi:hypothetical protein
MREGLCLTGAGAITSSKSERPEQESGRTGGSESKSETYGSMGSIKSLTLAEDDVFNLTGVRDRVELEYATRPYLRADGGITEGKQSTQRGAEVA